MTDEQLLELTSRIAVLEEKVSRLERLQGQAAMAPATTPTIMPAGSIRTRDKTRYIFNGRTCLKNRLVWEIVNQYVEDHPGIDFDTLQSVFVARLQGGFGVVARMQDIKPERQIRYFWKEPITVNGDLVVVCNQWGIGNIAAFLTLARSLGYIIREV